VKTEEACRKYMFSIVGGLRGKNIKAPGKEGLDRKLRRLNEFGKKVSC